MGAVDRCVLDYITDNSKWNECLFLIFPGVVLTGLSFLSIIVYGLLDKWSERYVPKKARPPEKINIKAVFRFDARFWLVSLVTVLYYGGVTPFLAAARYVCFIHNLDNTK